MTTRILHVADDEVVVGNGAHSALARAEQRVIALGLATKDFVHDFNNLLAVIVANADLLIDQLGDSDPRRLDAEAVRAAAQRATGLTRQLFELGQTDCATS
jgi:signal transduction histidine kinase